MRETNGMDLHNQTSNYVNQEPNYGNQSCFYINHLDVKTNCYAALQDGGWTRNDYQHLQG